MSTLTCIETFIDNEQNNFGSCIIEPLEIGQGITLGNALRRTLLSDLTGYSITGVRINNLKHEFATIEGVREDVLEILLNLKDIIFKSSFKFDKQISELNSVQLKGFLNTKGPIIITAGMLNLPKGVFKIINPNQYICTITDSSDFYLEVDIERGKGYRLVDEIRKKAKNEKVIDSKPSTLLVDAIFMPIKKVNYKIKLIHDSKGNIKESLEIQILTNGSITPKRSIQEALKILMNLLYPLFISPNFLNLSSKVLKN
jgi:DNA-directed RNA polymerase subunit alpha